MTTVYDVIGTGYVATRRADPRIASAINAALGDAASVVNVGAGAGSGSAFAFGASAFAGAADTAAARPSSRPSPSAFPSPTAPSTWRWPY